MKLGKCQSGKQLEILDLLLNDSRCMNLCKDWINYRLMYLYNPVDTHMLSKSLPVFRKQNRKFGYGPLAKKSYNYIFLKTSCWGALDPKLSIFPLTAALLL